MLSRVSARLSPSGIRKLEALASATPGLISLGPGQPDSSLFPATEIASMIGATFDDSMKGAHALQYGASQGDPALIELLVSYMRERGVACDASNILITAGAQQALDLICQLLADDGDTVLVQTPTYPGALQAFRARGANVMALDETVENASNDDASHRAKFIYAMADFQNPTGDVLDIDARKALLATARRRDLFVVEDSPYREIAFSERALPPTLLQLDSEHAADDARRVLYTGSFSKVIAPGLRVGWVVGPAHIVSLLTLLRQGSDLQPSTLSQAIVAGLLARGIDPHIGQVRRRYAARRDAMLDALHAHLAPYATWNAPEGGFFIWVRLNAAIDTTRLLLDAIENGVAYVPGSEFDVDGRDTATLRLSFSSVDPAQIDAAIRRLARTVASALAR